jgi:hypothetical protein
MLVGVPSVQYGVNAAVGCDNIIFCIPKVVRNNVPPFQRGIFALLPALDLVDELTD